MVKLNVMYPAAAGMRFDHAYYREKHMPMVARLLGSACLHYSIDKGLAGGAPGSASPYAASCSIFCESAESLQRAMAPHAAEIMADIANYTDAKPQIWISEVVEDRAARP